MYDTEVTFPVILKNYQEKPSPLPQICYIPTEQWSLSLGSFASN